MANLYDLELQESNNFIHLLLKSGESPSLRLFRDQMEMSAAMGPAGEEIVKSLQDPSSEMGKSFKRLNDIEEAVKEVMRANDISSEEAEKAEAVFKRSPATMEDLSKDDQNLIKEYWIKKKMCVSGLVQKGFTYQEIFS